MEKQAILKVGCHQGEVDFERAVEKKKWKEISNCPGRYVLRKKHGETHLPPNQFLLSLFPDSLMNTSSLILDGLDGSRGDPVSLIFFRDGGGLLTYMKYKFTESEGHDGGNRDINECSPLYVHTLNTSSGMRRKLLALGIIDMHLQKIEENENGTSYHMCLTLPPHIQSISHCDKKIRRIWR